MVLISKIKNNCKSQLFYNSVIVALNEIHQKFVSKNCCSTNQLQARKKGSNNNERKGLKSEKI